MSDLIISEPLTVIQGLFEKGGKGDWGVEAFFSLHFATADDIEKVPSLNDRPLHALTDGCLVRYRCMIQDQFEPEYYLNTYQLVNTATGGKVLCCGKYRDVFNYPPNYELNEDPDVTITDERTTLYCVPIPAETEWAKAAFRRDTDGPVVEDERSSRRGTKRGLCDEGDGDDEWMDSDVQSVDGVSKRCKQHDGGHIEGDGGQKSLPGLDEKEISVSCLVKVYGDSIEQFKVASMVEFVGILSVSPSLACFDHNSSDPDQDLLLNPFAAEGAAERKAHSPPPSLVPRLHCILSRTLSHSNPLVTSGSLPLLKDSSAVGVARELALSVLTEVLLGDRLAAEYTLLHMLSSVYGRTEVLALGSFAVNISRCPVPGAQSLSFASSFFSVLQDLVPKCHLLPMTLANMNTLRFTPKKDYETNRIQPGTLQFSAGTLLVIDETQLSPGRLNEQGVKNLASLCHLSRWQKIHYDFQYYNTEFNCDTPVMVFSEGRSMIKDNCEVPLDPVAMAPSGDRAIKRLTEHQLHNLREYLGVCREIQYSLPTEFQTIVGDDFVALRKVDPGVTADTLHHLLCLARLVSISYGCAEMSVEQWRHVRELELQRKNRLLRL